MTTEWSLEQRVTFRTLADVLIPATERFPSASEADPQARLLDRGLRARPDLAELLAPVLADILADPPAGEPMSTVDPAATLERLRGTDGELFEGLATLAIGVYYMSPEVLQRLSYPGQRANPPRPDEAAVYLSDRLLEPVLRRGPRYRPTPPPAGLE